MDNVVDVDRLRIRGLVLVAISVFLVGPTGVDVARGEDAPSFQTEEARKAFADAQVLFEKGDWKPAQKLFKASRKGTDGSGKKSVKVWIKACQGGSKLARVEKAIEKERWHDAFTELQRLQASYGETPLKTRMARLEEEIEAEIFFPLASFERNPPPPETQNGRPAGTSINRDARYVKSGERSLRWATSAGYGLRWLPLADFEGSMIEDHRYLNISLYSTDDVVAKYTLFFRTKNDPVTTGEANRNPMAILKTRCFFHHLTVTEEGWVDYRIDLWKELATHSGATRKEIEGVGLLIIPPSRQKTIYIDDVRLEKK